MQVIVSQGIKSTYTEVAIACTAVAAIASVTLINLPILAAVLGPIAIALAYRYHDRKLVFTIDEVGIYDARLGVGKIMWSDVSEVRIEYCYRNRFLCLRLKNPERFLRAARPAARAKFLQNSRLGFSQFNIDISGVDANVLLLKQFIEEKIA